MENGDTNEDKLGKTSTLENVSGSTIDVEQIEEENLSNELNSLNLKDDNLTLHLDKDTEISNQQTQEKSEEAKVTTEELLVEEKQAEPVFDGTEGPELEATRSSSVHTLDPDPDPETQSYPWPEKALALKNFVKERGAVAVSSVLRRLSGKKDGDEQILTDGELNNDCSVKDNEEEAKAKEDSQKAGDWTTWNPLNFIKIGREAETQSKTELLKEAYVEYPPEEPAMKGRIVVYTRLGCQDCKQIRLFLHSKRLKFVEINIDIYPSRKLELEKNTGSSAVPRIFFNDLLVGGLNELKSLDESGKLDETVNVIVNEEPSAAAPLAPLPGEDDASGSGMIDELAIIVKKMTESIALKDRFYKMRRFNNCFLGSEAVDFLAENQYLEREEAVGFGRKLARKHFFGHVFDENIFEDGNHLYRFLEHDPVVSTQCYNIPRGIINVKPKPIIEIASRLRFLSFAIFEAYVSEDGKHVDYRSIHDCEEFKRYLRIIEELQRVELQDMSREEKLAFFINLYNMMAIHAVLTWGYPVGALNRRKFLGDFKYVVGGCPYSLSAIQNGILRGNQRPPYNLTKPFGPKDKRSKVALPYPEPLIHFALVCSTRSGPVLRCYSPGDIDKELMESARIFLRNGGLIVDAKSKMVSVSKILRWYSLDFGKNEVEVLKHAANYLEPSKSEELLELLANTQLKVTYQTYDWDLNC